MTDHLSNATVRAKEMLARLSAQLDDRLMVSGRLSERGVMIIDPATVYVSPGVKIGAGTTIEPNTTISGDTMIGSDCRIGPNTVIEDSHIGDRCTVFSSVVRDSQMGDGSDLGPFGHVRGGSRIGEGVHLGHSVEVNRSQIGRGTKAAHFCYLGDADIGENVNIGAGTVTCNYDGAAKHKTVIEDGAFIGSDTKLVAPVRIGRGAVTGAGSVVTADVAAGLKVAGVPARPLGAERG